VLQFRLVLGGVHTAYDVAGTYDADKLDLDATGFTTCCVVEMTWVNKPDSYKNFGWAVTASTNTFGCQQSSLTMFRGLVGAIHFTSTNCVRGCVCAGNTSYDVARIV